MKKLTTLVLALALAASLAVPAFAANTTTLTTTVPAATYSQNQTTGVWTTTPGVTTLTVTGTV